jgi:phthalate 4,5-dioxygenase oxygenase subunit
MEKRLADTLTQVGPGTPCGNLLRRYWQPVALAEELPPRGDPVPLRIMGEDLVLFRDQQGRIGLLDTHCSHRGADLSFGRVEGGGLRCLYHGWVYDVHGNCLSQPCEPAGSTYHTRIKHPSYPCVEKSGLIFAYMGPGDPPLLPNYEFLNGAEDCVHVNKVHHECNFLQGNEGNIDPAHLSFLHAFEGAYQDGPSKNLSPLAVKDPSPTMEVDETDFGLRIHTLRTAGDGKYYLRVTNFVMPNLSAFPGGSLTGGYTVNWHVPIDDTHHWGFKIILTRVPDKAFLDKAYFEDGITEDYMPIRNMSNRYMQNRRIMNWSFSGIGDKPGSNFTAQDAWATVSQGPVQDRTREHLGYSDKVIVAARRQLFRAIQDVQDGKDPLHVVRKPDANNFDHLVIRGEVITDTDDWVKRWQLEPPPVMIER